MRRIIAILAAAALSALLSGCNMVMSDTPWFTPSDQSPQLRTGLWVMLKPGCNVAPATPPTAWPECASALYVRGRAFLTPALGNGDGKPHGAAAPLDLWDSTTPVLAPGDPPGGPIVLQLHLESGPGSSVTIPADKLPYLYFAVRAAAHAADGTISEATLWPVVCGPPPPGADKSPPPEGMVQSATSDKPFPGLTAAGSDPGCKADSEAALRGAAAKSEAVAAANGFPPITARWLRAGLTP